MGTLGTSIKNTVVQILNNPSYRSAITITPRTPTKGSQGGYDAVADNEGTAVSTYGVPASYIPQRSGLLPQGDLIEGETRLILKPTETINTQSKITFDSIDWDVREIKELFFNDVLIAYVVSLSRKTP